MSNAELVQFLQEVAFLRNVNQEDLPQIVKDLERRTFEENEVIVQQDAPVNGLYFVFAGSVEKIHVDPRKNTTYQSLLSNGEIFGEVELRVGQAWKSTVRAKERTTILRWPIASLDPFLKTHPESLSFLSFTAKSRHLASKLRFNWLREDETVHGLARKHPIMLVRALILPLIFLGGAIALANWAISDRASTIGWLGAIIALLSLALIIWRWVDWRNDYCIVTNRRAVWLEKVVGLYDNRQETPLHWVLSISISTDILGRLLDYGDVVIRTYTGQLLFHNVGHPQVFASVIQEYWRRMKQKQVHTDREEMIRTLQERLELDEEAPPPELELLTDGEPLEIPEEPTSHIGLDQWTFKMRFEYQGVITYRKHWAVLLRQLIPPTTSLLLLFIFLILRIGGAVEFLSLNQVILYSVILSIVLILWWLYRYADWVNDIYQITPTQIVDVNKKPLAREVRKVAPLENILGTEVDRKGFIGIMLNYGAVITNVGTEQFTFRGVYDPANVQQEIVQAQEAFLEREAAAQRRQRREEVVEWLTAYHEEVAHKRSEPREEDED
jgi:CRP-like cAMP-binding protein